MKMKFTLVMVWTLAIMVFPLANVSYANLMNGDFSDGLNGWTAEGFINTEGDVQVVNEEAVLGDSSEWWSALYQPVALDPFLYTFEFDFSYTYVSDYSKGLSDDVPTGTFPDTFYASLYFVTDNNQFDLSSPPPDSLELFNLDYMGPYLWDENDNEIPINGEIGTSSKGDEWFHFSTTFNNTKAYVIPTFELSDLNFIDSDSQVLIDNVSINPVPEPATLLLLGSGLFALAGMARKRRKD